MPRSLLPFLLAVAFAGLSLVDRGPRLVTDNDAARHMMNGALIHDMIRGGGLTHPVEFARKYYGYYPAISLPYHPPLFPIVEAAFFLITGVDPLVPRLLVSTTVFAAVLLAFALLRKVTGSVWIAGLTTASFFSMRICRDLASDIRLEMPCLALILAALYCLRNLDGGLTLRDSLLFAGFASAAFWTKQTAAFLGLVPWLLLILAGRWHEMKRLPVWLLSAIFGSSCVLLLAIPRLAMRWSGAGAAWHGLTWWDRVVHHLRIYPTYTWQQFGTVATLLIVSGILLAAVSIFLRSEGWITHAFLLAWIVPSYLAPLVTDAYDPRYILHAFPALIALALLALTRAAGLLLPSRAVWAPAAISSALFCLSALRWTPDDLTGIREGAQFTAAQRPQTLLYCGPMVGDFIANLRTFNQPGETILVRSDQLEVKPVTPDAVDRFSNQFGIETVVVMNLRRLAPRDEWVRQLPTAKMKLVREFPISSCGAGWNGSLSVYRFTDPSPNPDRSFRVRSQTLGRGLDVDVQP